MTKAKVLIVDGTFRSVPNQFSQLITIKSIIYGRSFPIAFILCRSKQETTYLRLFQLLNEYTTCKPDYIKTDFEKGLANSLSKIFPSAKSHACLFHFGQTCWRRIQEVGLAIDYKKNISLQSHKRKILNLYFLNEANVEDMFIRNSKE
ncbi:hypothetical protein DMUE_1054 [Dictyocoela muelleri]|nr:hypothetical protein DMUE_1054 [Dictyocoela muelleri]